MTTTRFPTNASGLQNSAKRDKEKRDSPFVCLSVEDLSFKPVDPGNRGYVGPIVRSSRDDDLVKRLQAGVFSALHLYDPFRTVFRSINLADRHSKLPMLLEPKVLRISSDVSRNLARTWIVGHI